MARLFVRHHVADYSKWRDGYDAFDDRRHELGVKEDGVFQAVDDPNDVTVWHEFEEPGQAAEFIQSRDLREVMQRAGVEGQPEIWITEEA